MRIFLLSLFILGSYSIPSAIADQTVIVKKSGAQVYKRPTSKKPPVSQLAGGRTLVCSSKSRRGFYKCRIGERIGWVKKRQVVRTAKYRKKRKPKVFEVIGGDSAILSKPNEESNIISEILEKDQITCWSRSKTGYLKCKKGGSTGWVNEEHVAAVKKNYSARTLKKRPKAFDRELRTFNLRINPAPLLYGTVYAYLDWGVFPFLSVGPSFGLTQTTSNAQTGFRPGLIAMFYFSERHFAESSFFVASRVSYIWFKNTLAAGSESGSGIGLSEVVGYQLVMDRFNITVGGGFEYTAYGKTTDETGQITNNNYSYFSPMIEGSIGFAI